MIDWSHPFWSCVHPEAISGCWLWHGALTHPKRKAPYGAYRSERAHRVAYQLIHGEIPHGAVVRHTCDVTQCVNPDHLLVGTQAENIADKVARGRAQRLRGELNGRHVLTWDAVREIRVRLGEGQKQWDVAHAFGVGQSVISRISRGTSWREPGIAPRSTQRRAERRAA